jgi:hypothetical protein
LLSSAILYVAIVVIWACVLIPRWLRRDSSASGSGTAEQAEGGAVAETGAEEEPVPEPVRVPRESAEDARPRRPAGDPAELAEAADAAEPADPVHRRVVSARRRLLMMLIALSVASGVLAGTRMAAWWVIVPPSVMLLSYMLLLRAAAKADAERREIARHRMARAAAEASRAPVRRTAPEPPVAPVAKVIAFLPPPEEQIYDQYADAKLRAVGD